MTVNTDFAQTEVDQRQVNLTRFSLLYPEKRDFFLDGATFFDFASPGAGAGGNNSQNNANFGSDLIVNPFFSRRIGLSDAGDEQKILFGTKATGQLAGQDIGILDVRTGDDHGLIGEDFTVARLKHRLMRQSYVGAAYTRRDPHAAGADTRQTLGLDFRLATSAFRRNQNLSLSGWYVDATQPGPITGTQAYGATLAYPNDLWNANLDVRTVERNFNPAVGFVTRNAYRRYLPYVNFGPRPRNNRAVRQYNFAVTSDIQTTLDNTLIARNFTIKLFEPEMASNDRFALLLIPHQRAARFALQHQHRAGPPRHAAARLVVRFRPLPGERADVEPSQGRVAGRYEAGDFYSGTRKEFVSNVTFRILPGLFVASNPDIEPHVAAELQEQPLNLGMSRSFPDRLLGQLEFYSLPERCCVQIRSLRHPVSSLRLAAACSRSLGACAVCPSAPDALLDSLGLRGAPRPPLRRPRASTVQVSREHGLSKYWGHSYAERLTTDPTAQ